MSLREKTANCDPGKSWQNGNCSGSKCSFGRLFQDHLCREHKVAREERAKQSSEDLLKIGLIGSRFAKSYYIIFFIALMQGKTAWEQPEGPQGLLPRKTVWMARALLHNSNGRNLGLEGSSMISEILRI